MSYKSIDKSTGEVKDKFTLKERIAYHTNLCNKGKDKDGNILTTAQRVRHGVLAEKQKRKLNKFMSKPKSMRDAIVKESKAKK